MERAHERGELEGMGAVAVLTSAQGFADYLRQLRQKAWVVYAKRPFAGPEQVIEYIGRYTHRVAISNRRIVGMDEATVSFRWKDYRDGEQVKVMRLAASEFIRRFLSHVLPPEFVRIRHYGILANGRRKQKVERCRELLAATTTTTKSNPMSREERQQQTSVDQSVCEEAERCESCGVGRMVRWAELSSNYEAHPPNIERQMFSITHRARASPAV